MWQLKSEHADQMHSSLPISISSFQIDKAWFCAGEDTDQPQSVQDQHALMGKIRLMKQFMWGVAVYVIATGEPGPC